MSLRLAEQTGTFGSGIVFDSQYMDVELQRIRKEQGLTVQEMATILRCDLRQVYRYLDGSQRCPCCRWRLLLLELGLAVPDWTNARRQSRASESPEIA